MPLLRDLRHLLSYARRARPDYVVAIAALSVVNFLDSSSPKLTQWAIDEIQGRPTPLARLLAGHSPGLASWLAHLPGGRFLPYALAILLLAVVAGAFRVVMTRRFMGASIRIATEMRGAYFRHLVRLPLSYFGRARTGDLMSRAVNDVDAVRFFFGIGMLIGVDTLLYLVLVPGFMLSISWQLALLCLLPLPLIPLVVNRLGNAIHLRFEEVQERFSELSNRAQESIAGMQVVKSFAREDRELAAFTLASTDYLGRNLRLARLQSLFGPVMALMVGLEELLVLVVGGQLALSGKISVGAFVAFVQYLLRLAWPLVGLGWVISLYQRARASLARYQEVMSEPEVSETVPGASSAALAAAKPESVPAMAPPGEPAAGAARPGVSLELRGLRFAYPPGESDHRPEVLRGISLRLSPGRTLGLMGQVGSGKSSLLQLLPRLLEPPPGTVLVGGVDVRTIPLSELRRRVVLVPQEAFLFADTVANNVAVGLGDAIERRADSLPAAAAPPAAALPRPGQGAPDPRIVEACVAAGIDQEVTALPSGYDTLLGEKGVNLSGGQKQRLTLARALAARPALLLLDDCLAAVDSQTEARILAALRTIRGRCTTVIASQRVAAVRDADQIVVLAEGCVLERGTHAELVAQSGSYADLVRKQALEEEIRSLSPELSPQQSLQPSARSSPPASSAPLAGPPVPGGKQAG